MSLLKNVYSDFECDMVGFKMEEEEAHQIVECVASVEQEMTTKTVTKKCRGIVKKSRTKGTGEGTIKIAAHMPYDLYAKTVGLSDDKGLIDGVVSYGQLSTHQQMSVTMRTKNEDDDIKYVAYPNCKMANYAINKIDNGAEEVAEIEMELNVYPDERGQGKYEAVASTLSETVAAQWMKSFTPTLVTATEA